MRKIIIFCFILCLSSNLGAVRLYYCFNKNTETVTVSHSAKDPIVYRSFVHDIDESNHGIVTIHPLMDVHGIGMWENPRNVEYYPIVSIDDNAFAGCNWITRINISASIKTIGRNVFMGCENLREIYVDANNPYFTSDDGVLYNKEKTILIKFPAGKDASTFTIPKTVKEIADDAFEGVKMDNTISKDEGNPSFDETINYQFNNAQAYIGEILYLMPITGSYYDCPHYQRFKNFDADENDITYNAITNQYKFDPSDYRDYKFAGTHKRHIEGHEFYVDNVVQYLDYKYQWVFYLTDLNTGDRLKFDYYGEPELFMNSFIDFPFITMKYFNYYKSLIGTNLVFATHESIVDIDELESTYNPDFKDINTGEVVQFSGAYAKWKIKDVIIDKYNLCLTFIVTNGKNTIKIPYNVPYSTKTKQPQYWISKYPAGVRVFPEAQWNEMINKYGEQHMSLIMNSKVSDDMTLDEKYLAGGRRLATSKKDEKSTSDALKEIGKTAVKSTKKTVSDGVKIIKSIFK